MLRGRLGRHLFSSFPVLLPEQRQHFEARWADDEAEFWVHSVCGTTQMINCSNMNEIYSFHSGGANFLYGDGSVHFHSETIEADTFVSLFTRAAGDIVSR